jgi:hypothetical protein
MLRILRNLFSRAPSPAVIQAREELYRRCFGATPEINHSTNRVFPHIDIYRFEPTPARPFHTLITGGMAEYQQPVEEDSLPRRLELLMYLQPFQVWALNLLKGMAEYPAQQGVAFARWHTVPIGYRLTDTSEISAFLLAPLDTEDLSRLSFDGYDDPVEYLLAVPLTMTEHAYAREVGSEELYQRLKQADLLVHRDDHRPPVLEYEPLERE